MHSKIEILDRFKTGPKDLHLLVTHPLHERADSFGGNYSLEELAEGLILIHCKSQYDGIPTKYSLFALREKFKWRKDSYLPPFLQKKTLLGDCAGKRLDMKWEGRLDIGNAGIEMLRGSLGWSTIFLKQSDDVQSRSLPADQNPACDLIDLCACFGIEVKEIATGLQYTNPQAFLVLERLGKEFPAADFKLSTIHDIAPNCFMANIRNSVYANSADPLRFIYYHPAMFIPREGAFGRFVPKIISEGSWHRIRADHQALETIQLVGWGSLFHSCLESFQIGKVRGVRLSEVTFERALQLAHEVGAKS